MRFADVVGQQEIKDKLLGGIRSGRVPHAQLFLGAEGNGNLALALAYMQYLSCQNPSETDSCGECPSCGKMTRFIHPDLHFTFPVISSREVESSKDLLPQWREALTSDPYVTYTDWMSHLKAENKQGNIPIKECHEIIRTLTLKPFESPYKMLLMWLPEYLGKEGNSLLKMIEEPPQQTVFILVAQRQELILNTILSRTHIVRIPPVAADDIARALEQRQTDGSLAQQAAVLSEGNFKKALLLAEQTESRLLDPFRNWLLACYRSPHVELMRATDSLAEEMKREQLKAFFDYGLQVLRDCLHTQYRKGRPSARMGGEAAFIEGLVKLLDAGRIDQLNRVFNKAIFDIERNGNARIVLFDLSLSVRKIFHP